MVKLFGFSANQNKHSKCCLSTVPLIQSEVLVVNKHPQKLDSITLRYTPTPTSSSHFDLYRFMLSDPSIPIKEKAANDTDMKVTFTGLKPGRLYNITVWTVSDGIASQPLLRQDRLCKYIKLWYFLV
jgi:cadherin 5 type 2 (VE-cadherin)